MNKAKQRRKNIATLIPCADCNATLQILGNLFSSFSVGRRDDWFMVKDRVWREGQRKGACRFLCVECLESRIDRKLSAVDFKRSAKVNFVGRKSLRLLHRMRGLRPAKRLVNTTFIL